MSETMMVMDTRAVESEVAPVIQAARALIVRNVDEHRAALEMLAALMGAKAKVEKFFEPMLDAAKEAKKKAEDARKAIALRQEEVLGPVLEARDVVSKTCATFEREERRVTELNQRALQVEALAKQEAQRAMDAAMAETEEEAEDALTAPLPEPVVATVRPEVAKVAGVSTRETWAAEVIDKPAFLAWAAKPENNYMAEPNLIALNSRARAEHDAMKIPGVKAVSTLSHARR